jgi:hypothetical protein
MRKLRNSRSKPALTERSRLFLLHPSPGLRDTIDPDDIFFLEATEDDTSVRSRSARRLRDVRTLGELEPILRRWGFVRTHRNDIEPGFIGPLLDEAAVRFSRHVVLHEGPELPERVLRAWEMGAQDRLIAEADVANGKLIVLTCALERLEIPLADFRPLARLPKVQRGEFELASDGSHLHWSAADVHLDLDALRAVVDPAWRDRMARERAIHDGRFGRAVSVLRREHGLKQADIPGVSARQVRRIEGGSLPRSETLRRLARAHGLELGAYLDRVSATTERLRRSPDRTNEA